MSVMLFRSVIITERNYNKSDDENAQIAQFRLWLRWSLPHEIVNFIAKSHDQE